MSFSVAVYLVDRAYGGSEEGGWWFSTGDPDDEFVRFAKGFRDQTSAERYRDRLDRVLCRRLNRGRPSIGSVLSRGQFQASVQEGHPKAWPETRPHYE